MSGFAFRCGRPDYPVPFRGLFRPELSSFISWIGAARGIDVATERGIEPETRFRAEEEGESSRGSNDPGHLFPAPRQGWNLDPELNYFKIPMPCPTAGSSIRAMRITAGLSMMRSSDGKMKTTSGTESLTESDWAISSARLIRLERISLA